MSLFTFCSPSSRLPIARKSPTCSSKILLYWPDLLRLFPRFHKFFLIGDLLFIFRFPHIAQITRNNSSISPVSPIRDTSFYNALVASSFFAIFSLALSNTRYYQVPNDWEPPQSPLYIPSFAQLIYRRRQHFRTMVNFYIPTLLNSKSPLRQFPDTLNIRFAPPL